MIVKNLSYGIIGILLCFAALYLISFATVSSHDTKKSQSDILGLYIPPASVTFFYKLIILPILKSSNDFEKQKFLPLT